MKKWIIPVLYAAVLALAFSYRHEITDWLESDPRSSS